LRIWHGLFAATEEFALQNLAKTRDWLSSNLQFVTAPFARFFIANTLHHRLLARVLFVARAGGVQ
jgi:hypothetical protein